MNDWRDSRTGGRDCQVGYAFRMRLASWQPGWSRLAGLLAAILLVGGCGSTGTSRVQMAERPTWSVGDSWSYKGQGRDGAYTVTRKVLREGTFAGREGYEVDAGQAHNWYTRQLGYLGKTVGDRTVRLASPPEDWQWPLLVGKSWSATVAWIDYGEQEKRYTLTSVWFVETVEDLKTPAGTFKTFKVVRREVESGAHHEFWYSPDVRGWVKVRGFATADGDYEEELTAYQVH